MEFTGLTPGSEAVYTCDDGYEIEGESTRTCKMDSTWSGEAPQCVELSEFIRHKQNVNNYNYPQIAAQLICVPVPVVCVQ